MTVEIPSRLRLALAALLFILVPGSAALAQKPLQPLAATEPIAITAIPIDFDRDRPERRDFGKLTYRGGLNLFGKSQYFGGYSAIALDASGTSLLALSDAGTWLRAELDHDGRKLKGVGDASIGPILGRNGKPLFAETERDSEGMTLLNGDTKNGTVLVSFERKHRIEEYPFTLERFGPPKGSLKLPKETARMSQNRGIEALARILSGRLAGTIVAVSERSPDKDGNLRGWMLGGKGAGPIRFKTRGGLDITDIAALPDGGLVLLERRFRLSEGLKIRLRRIDGGELRPGALLDGEVLLEATDLYNIDNIEGIAAHRAANGETILTLISDDNFSPLQRTLLLQFALADG